MFALNGQTAPFNVFNLLRFVLLGDYSINKLRRNWRSETQECFGLIFRFDFTLR